LGAALESLTSQTCTAPFEIVVVDNDSEDGTRAVVDAAARADPRIRSVREPRVGLSYAKNAGIRASRGSLVLFTDDDVVVESGWIQTYVDFFRRERGTSVVAGGPVRPIQHDLSQWPSWVDRAAWPDLPSLDHGEAERPLRAPEWLWGANMAAPGPLLKSLGGFRTELGRGARASTFEDVDLVERIRGLGGEAWYLPGAGVQHRADQAASRPRQILVTAFNRGGNNRVGLRHGTYYVAALPLPTGRVAGGALLPGLLLGLLVFTGGFRLTRDRRAFDAARRCAWGAGWCMWSLVGESSRRRARAVRAAVLTVRRLALGLTPA
jgi:GT2 family glycosyltransferase